MTPRFTSARLEEGSARSYSLGLLAMLLPGLVLTLAFALALVVIKRRATTTGLRAGWKWRMVVLVAVIATAVACALSIGATRSATAATGSTRALYTDTFALMDGADFMLARIHNRTLALRDQTLPPLLAGALALPANTSLPEVDSLRATADSIAARWPALLDAVGTARAALGDARALLLGHHDAVEAVQTTGSDVAIVVGVLLCVLFAVAPCLAVASTARVVLPLGGVLVLVVLLLLPVSSVVDDACAYYGDLEPRARETSALALACLENTDLLVATGASIDALSPDLLLQFPIMTAVNTTTALGNATHAALLGVQEAEHVLAAGLFLELRYLRGAATCGHISADAIAFRDNLCTSGRYLGGVGWAAMVVCAGALLGLFARAPDAPAYAPVATSTAVFQLAAVERQHPLPVPPTVANLIETFKESQGQ